MRESVDTTTYHERLMMALAEQLKTPLVQIGQLSELLGDDMIASRQHKPTTDAIRVLTTQALRAIDAFMLAEKQTSLRLEPVSVGAVLYDVAHDLHALAKEYDMTIEIDSPSRSVPVMADRRTLHALLSLLGGVIIQSPDAPTELPDKRRLILGSHSSKDGVVVGAFGSHNQSTPAGLTAVRALYGRASQGSGESGLQGMASMMLADTLSAQLQSVLKAYKHGRLQGMGMVLTPSRQLALLS